MDIIPRPKRFVSRAGCFVLQAATRLKGAHAGARQAGELLTRCVKELTGRNLKTAGVASVRNRIGLELADRLAGVPDVEGAYRLIVQPEQIVLQARTADGLRYAAQSLLGLLERSGGHWRWPAGEIVDWPDFGWRGFLIDPARKFIPLECILEHIDRLAAAKMNVLHIHFTDNEGFTLESKRLPRLNERFWHPMLFGAPRAPFTTNDILRAERDHAGVYTRRDIDTMVRYGRARGVHILPELSMPSHSAPILRLFPELKCQVDKAVHHTVASPTVLCIGNAKTYQILEQVIDEFAPLFPYPVLHTGADEIECRDVLYECEPFYSQRWAHCSVCRARMQREGLTSIPQLFYYFIRRVRRILAKHNKRCMIWNDYIDIAKPVDLPRDILIHFWQIALPNRGPRHGCSFAKFLQAGFEMVNSNSLDTYIDEAALMRERKLLKWNPATVPFSPPDRRRQILGGELCAWAHKEHYGRTLPAGLALFADRVWNRVPIDDVPAYAAATARHLFGPALPVDLSNLLARFGAIVPPRSSAHQAAAEERTMPESVLTAKQDWIKLAHRLGQALRNKRLLNRPLLSALHQSAQSMLKTRLCDARRSAIVSKQAND